MDYAGAPSSHPLRLQRGRRRDAPARPAGRSADLRRRPQRQAHAVQARGAATRKIATSRLVWDKPLIVPESRSRHLRPRSRPSSSDRPSRTGATSRKWYGEAVRGFTEADEEVRRMAAELTKGKKTREEKLRPLRVRRRRHPLRELRPAWWWLPNRPQQLLARREGDCDDDSADVITSSAPSASRRRRSWSNAR